MPMSTLSRLLLLGCFALPLAARAEPPAADMRAEIAKKLEVDVENVRPSPVPGLYEVSHGMEIGYVSTDGRFYIDGDVFEQDMCNLPYVQEGLKASKNGLVHLGNYQEIRIRQFQQTLDKYLAREP